MPMIVTVAGCKGFWIPGQARNDELGARNDELGARNDELGAGMTNLEPE